MYRQLCDVQVAGSKQHYSFNKVSEMCCLSISRHKVKPQALMPLRLYPVLLSSVASSGEERRQGCVAPAQWRCMQRCVLSGRTGNR